MATVDASTKESGMNYEEMSDFEINKAVAEHFYDTDWLDRHATHAGMIPDYCNNQSDAWPIMLDNKIGVWNHPSFGDEWTARLNIVNTSTVVNEIEYATHRDKNPLRAAMIVFLMMKDEQNV